jgi:hypothetical protein
MRNLAIVISRFLPIVFLMVLPMFSWSQKSNRFSGDSTKFIGELNTIFFNLSDNEKKIIAPYMEEFVQKWNTEIFSPSRKKAIYFICNEMARRKVRPYPDFFNYINVLNVFVNSNQPDRYFHPWSDILKKLIEEKNLRAFTAFLDFSTHLFAENLVYKSSSAKWKLKMPDFRFEYDTVPRMTFLKSDLVCYANDDSLLIYQTKGIYYPLSNIWVGTGGRVDWRRAGHDPDKVYADLVEYRVQMRFARFTADSVSFVYKKYFNSPVMGRYTDKVLADVTEEKASYPRFYSNDKMIGIPGVFKNIDYLGGFALEGSRILGSGDKAYDARLFFKRDGKDFLVARSKTFVIRPDRINAATASVTIYYEGDSIFHPGLQLKYLDEHRELSFTKDERVATISPWYDSYHQIEIYTEALYWNVGDPTINFEMMKGPGKESKCVFESSNYYSLHRYEKLQGIDEQNPLNIIKKYLDRKKTKLLTLEELTVYMSKPMEQVEALLLRLANRGFLVYDFDDKTATIKDKLFDYVNARNGKSDYDVIFFNSDVTGKSNGVLRLDSFNLRIQGVNSVMLSDSQQVIIYPKSETVVLQKGLNFVFDGKIEAGLFDFWGDSCAFIYDRFRIDLPHVDSMMFYVTGKTWDPKTGKFPLVRVKTALTNLSGELLIDDPQGKSGLKALPQYPIFTNRDNAYVYWNKNTTQKGVYKKDRFFFEVDPFTINSLDVVSTDSLDFAGDLTSAGIFPKITEPLKVRPDYSLGMEKSTGDSGYQTYGGKGIFTSKIDLSDRGLRGDGTLQYLNSTSVSPDFVFLPDSMNAIARSFVATEQVGETEYPSVVADSVSEFWLPYKDSLIIGTLKKDMTMYNSQSTFAGKLALTPRALTGNGTVKIKDAEMDSKGFSFKSHSFDALIANFRIKSYDLADLTISTKNYQTHFDFDQRKGEFKSNVGISKVEFPLNKYVCSMDRFDWLIDSDEILLSNEQSLKNSVDTLSYTQLIDVAYTGSEFISVHPLQDSLKFFAEKARYNLRTNVINAENVKIIKVADAAVYPDSGKVRIFKDAQMEVLKNAGIIANTKTRYHDFYNAQVSIASRKNYTGNGNYNYKDRAGELEQITFSRIRVDTSGQTVAEGEISDSAKFNLSPEFAFKGAVKLTASSKNLFFDGGFRPVTDCFHEKAEWVKFEAPVDPQRVQLPVTTPLRNTQHETVNLGLMFYNTEGRLNPTFFERKNSFSDTMMVTSSGFAEYNLAASEFRIASREKLANRQEPGPFISLNTTNCMLHGEGKINLSMNPGNMKLETYGSVDYFVIPDSLRAHVAIGLDFPFSPDATAKLSAILNSVNLTGINLATTPYNRAMEYLMDKKEADRLKGEIELVGKYKKFPEQLDRTLFLADVKFKFDTVSKSYVSYGQIGIANVGKNQVARYVNGIIEFTKKRNGDDFTIYLELTKNDWFFFNYRNNLMQVLSSDIDFNDIIIKDAQSKNEISRLKKLAKGYRYSVSTERKKRDFLRKFETEE